MSNYWEFLTFPPLSMVQKARLAIGILKSKWIKDPSHLEKQTATEWLIKIFGQKVYQTIWEPLLISKFGVLKDQIPATIIWATINRYYSTRSKGEGKEYMGHLHGCGYKPFFDLIADVIQQNHGEIHCSCKVLEVDDTDPQKIQVQCEGKTFAFDSVISTIPTALIKRIGPKLQWIFNEDYHPKFLGVIRLALVLRHSLTPYYVTNLIERGFPFTGIIEVSALTDDSEMGGHKLLMLPRYELPDSPWFQKPEEEIKQIFLDKMRSIWPDIDDNIIRSYVHREKVVQALWLEGPPTRFTPNKTQDGRVWSVNAEIAGRDSLNNNAIVRVADSAAEEFIRRAS